MVPNVTIVNGVVYLGNLRLGKDYELQRATDAQIWRAIISAIGWSDYDNIKTSRGFRIH
jgi:hypothetical protein